MTLEIMPHGILKGIEQFKVSTMNMDILNENGLTIINDINDTSMSSVYGALEMLCNANGRRICILGDLPGHGKDDALWHYELGKYVSGKDIDLVIAIGKLARNIYLGAVRNKKSCADIEYFPVMEQFMEEIDGLINSGDTVLVKASPEIGFEEIVEELMR